MDRSSSDAAEGGLRLAVVRSVGASALAVVLVAVLLAGPFVYTLLLATGVVAAARWGAKRLDVHWQAQQLHVQWRAERPAFEDAPSRLPRSARPGAAAASAPPPGAPSDAWRAAFPDAALQAEVEALASRVVDDFVVDLWYRSITPDGDFPAEVRALICAVLAALASRVRSLNLGALLIRDACDVLAEQLELYRRVHDSIGEETLGRLAPDARDRALAAEMAADGDLLAAALGGDAELAVLRHVVDGLCPLLLPPHDRAAPLLRALARELLAAYVFRPAMGFFAPFWVNKLLLAALRASPPPASTPAADAAAKPPEAGASPALREQQVLNADARGLWDSAPLPEEPAQRSDSLAEATAADRRRHTAPPLSRASADEALPHGSTTTAVQPLQTPAPQRPLTASEPGPSGDAANSSESFYDPLRRMAASAGEPVEVAAAQSRSPGAADLPLSSAAGAPSPQPEPEPAPAPAHSATGPVRPAAGALRARVTGSTVVGDSFSTYVSYEILVSDGAGARWLVHRRFSNFEALHKRVKTLRARGRYKLPPKRILFHGTEGGFMDTRKELLDRYLQDMLADARLASSAELWDFLSAQSRSYVPAPGGGGVLKSVSQGLSLGLDSAVGAVRAELADASRMFDRKLERMKERWDRADTPPPGSSGAAAGAGRAILRGFDSSQSLSLSAAESASVLGGDESGGEDSGSEAGVLVSDGAASPLADDAASVTTASPTGAEPPGCAAQLPAAAAAGARSVYASAEPSDPAGLSLPLLDLVDAVFRLHEKGWVRRRMLAFARGVAELFVGGAVDEALASKLALLRRAETVTRLIRALREALWPGGVWYRTKQVAEARAAGREPPPTAPLGFGGVPPGREAEAAEDARAICALLLARSGSVAVERLVGSDAYRRGTLEVYQLLQSGVFVRQIGYNLLEALLAAACPEVCQRLLEARTLGLPHVT